MDLKFKVSARIGKSVAEVAGTYQDIVHASWTRDRSQMPPVLISFSEESRWLKDEGPKGWASWIDAWLVSSSVMSASFLGSSTGRGNAGTI